MKTQSNRSRRMYSVYDIRTGNNGQLVASLPWDDARGIYAGDDNSYLAVYCNRRGKICVKWLTSNHEATREEAEEAIQKLKAAAGGWGVRLPNFQDSNPLSNLPIK